MATELLSTQELDKQFCRSVGTHERGLRATLRCPSCKHGTLVKGKNTYRCDECEEILTHDGLLLIGNRKA